MKFMFLDIDGVLNYNLWFLKHKQNLLPIKYKKDFIDIEKIKLLNILIKETNVKTIISSSKRKYYSLKEFQIIFKKKKFIGEIIDTTPVLRIKRKDEINLWIKTNKKKYDIENYIIFDDKIITGHNKHFFLVNSFSGLSKKNINEGINYLNT